MSSLATITAEELAALIAERSAIIAERDALAGALRVTTTERIVEKLFTNFRKLMFEFPPREAA